MAIDIKALQAGYQPVDLGFGTPQKRPQGGIGGFFGNVVSGITKPAAKFVNQGAIEGINLADTIRMLVASQTGNAEAFRNANEQAKQSAELYGNTGGLLNAGTITNAEESKKGEFSTGAKKIGGTTAQIGSLLVPAGGAGLAGKAGYGALSGGLYGGGEALSENKDLGTAVQQALTGAAVGGGIGFGAGVAGKGIKAIRGGGTGGQQSLQQAAKQTAGANPLDRAGKDMFRSTLGVDDIVTPGKTKPYTIFKADELVDEARQIGLKGSPVAMQRQAGVAFNQLGSQVDDALAQVTKTAPVTGKNGLFTVAKRKVAKELPLNFEGTSLNGEIQRVGTEMADFATNGQITASGINKFKQTLSSRLSPAFNKLSNGQNLTGKEMVDMAFWSKADDMISQLAPQAKALTQKQSRIFGLANGLATQTRSIGPPSSLFRAGERVLGRPIGATQNALGRGMMAAGSRLPTGGGGGGATGGAIRSALSQVPSVTGSRVGNALTRGATIGAVEGAIQPQPESLDQAITQFSEQGLGGQQQPEQPQSPYSREQLLADIQNDPENMKDYVDYFETMQELFASPQNEPLTGTALKDSNNAQSGLQSLDLIEQTLGNDSSAAFKASIPNPLGITGRLTGTGDYRAASDNVADVIGRLRSGGAINDDELATFRRLLPQAGDSPEAAMYKINQVRSLLVPIANQVASGSSSNSLQDAVYAAQGGYR